MITFVPFELVSHTLTAGRANYAGAVAHIAALKAVIKPAMLINIHEDIAPAFGAAFSFPFDHIYSPLFQLLSRSSCGF